MHTKRLIKIVNCSERFYWIVWTMWQIEQRFIMWMNCMVTMVMLLMDVVVVWGGWRIDALWLGIFCHRTPYEDWFGLSWGCLSLLQLLRSAGLYRLLCSWDLPQILCICMSCLSCDMHCWTRSLLSAFCPSDSINRVTSRLTHSTASMLLWSSWRSFNTLDRSKWSCDRGGRCDKSLIYVYSDPKYTILQFLRNTYHILIYNTIILRTWAIL